MNIIQTVFSSQVLCIYLNNRPHLKQILLKWLQHKEMKRSNEVDWCYTHILEYETKNEKEIESWREMF